MSLIILDSAERDRCTLGALCPDRSRNFLSKLRLKHARRLVRSRGFCSHTVSLTWNLYFSITVDWKQKAWHQRRMEAREARNVLIKQRECSLVCQLTFSFSGWRKGFRWFGVWWKNNSWCRKSLIGRSSLCVLEVKALACYNVWTRWENSKVKMARCICNLLNEIIRIRTMRGSESLVECPRALSLAFLVSWGWSKGPCHEAGATVTILRDRIRPTHPNRLQMMGWWNKLFSKIHVNPCSGDKKNKKTTGDKELT